MSVLDTLRGLQVKAIRDKTDMEARLETAHKALQEAQARFNELAQAYQTKAATVAVLELLINDQKDDTIEAEFEPVEVTEPVS